MLTQLRTSTLMVSLITLFALLSSGCQAAQTPDQRIQELESQVSTLKKALKQNPLPAAGKSLNTSQSSNLIADVVEHAIPAVVSIHTEKIIAVSPHQYFNPFDFFFENPQQQRQPERREYKQQGLGSGVIVDKKGYIITNNHVVGEADELMVTLNDDREFEAEIVGTDKLSDVAIIKLKNPPKDLPILDLGNSDNIRIGETVIAIGSPFGYSNTVTSGIISAKGRQMGLNNFENYLQTDASINPGNSGGALINLAGELIGINTAIASRTGASNGIGFAIPITMVKNIMDDLLGSGKVIRGYLGVYLQPIDKNLIEALGLKNSKGALITSVIEDSPAQKAGFKEGDVITQVDGIKVKDFNHVRNSVAMLDPNKTYKFEIIRDKAPKTIKVKIGERDDGGQAKTQAPTKDDLGITVEDLNQSLAYQFRLKRHSGAIVTSVEPGSKADKAGFREGDIILKADGASVESANDFKKAVKNTDRDNILVQIERQDQKQYIGLKIK